MGFDRYDNHRQRIIAELCGGQTVLDIGYAQLPNVYLTSFYRVGVDLNSPAVPGSYDEELVGDATDLEGVLGNRQFDNVIAAEFIEHLEDPYAFLRGLRSRLTPNGRLILSTPNPISFPVILFEAIRSRRRFYTTEHTYYFTPRWIERLLVRSGFCVDRVRAVGLWNPFIALPVPVALSYQVVYVGTLADNES